MLHPEGCVRPPNAAGSSEAAAWRKVENKGHVVRWCPGRPRRSPRHGSQNTAVWLPPAAPPEGFQAGAAALHCCALLAACAPTSTASFHGAWGSLAAHTVGAASVREPELLSKPTYKARV